jgi:hypothetical protein
MTKPKFSYITQKDMKNSTLGTNALIKRVEKKNMLRVKITRKEK